jgi:hypothetical protein
MERLEVEIAAPNNALVRADCAPGGNRTPDQVLRRHLLYPLSYGRSAATHCGARMCSSWSGQSGDDFCAR